MKNLRKFLISAGTAVLTSIAALAISVSAATKAVDSSDVTKVTAGTSDSTQYALTISPTTSSTLSWWFDSGYSASDFQWSTSGDAGGKFIAARITDDNLSGHFGAWITGVGYYNGKQIDIKETYAWSALNLNCTPNLYSNGVTYSDSTGSVHVPVDIAPAVWTDSTAVSKAGGGVIGHYMAYHSYTVSSTFYYSDDHNTPVTISGNIRLTMGDIDYLQYYAVKANSGSITKVEAEADCNVYYAAENGYQVAYSLVKQDNANIPQDELSFVLSNADGYTVIYGSGADPFSYKSVITSSYSALGTAISSSGSYYYTYKNSWYTKAGSYTTITDPETMYGNCYCYTGALATQSDITTWATVEWAYINSFSYGPGTPTLKKYVTDTNESRVTSNAVGSYETYTYYIEVSLPVERAAYRYSAFVVSDSLPTVVDTISIASIKDAQTGNSVAGYFTTAVSDTNATITATSTALASDSFYGKTYIIGISVNANTANILNLTRNAYTTGGLSAYYEYSNTAALSWTIKSSTTARTQNSNTVSTRYYVKDLMATKSWSDSNFTGRPSSVTVTCSDGSTATLNSSNSWTATFRNLSAFAAANAKYAGSGTQISYTISETVPTGYTSTKATATVTDSGITYTKTAFTNTLNVGSVTVRKSVSPSGAAALSGFKFTLSGSTLNGTTISLTATTDESGIASFTSVPYGSYTLAETDVPSTATVSPASKNVTVSASAVTSGYYFTNTYTEPTGTINITKVVSPSKAAALSGFTFSLTGTSTYGTAVSKTATTDVDGKCSFTDVPYGTYTIKETNVPSNAAVSPASQSVTLSSEAATASYTFTNTYTENMGAVTVQKVVSPTTAASLSGFKFTLTGTSDYGTAVNLSGTTDADGKYTFSDVPYGTYTLKETDVPAGAAASPESQSVTVNATKASATYTVTNTYTENTGSVKVTKTSEDKAVAGISFKLTGTSSFGNAVSMTATTDTSGVATFSGVPVSNADGYTVTEVGTALRYITLAASTGIKVTANQTTELPVENKLTKTVISKVDESGNAVEGAVLAVLDSDGTEIDRWTSGTQAHTISGLERGSTYTLKEITPPTGYTTAADVTFKVNSTGTETKVSMEDQPTVISVTKYDAENKTLAGASMQIFDSDGEIVDDWITDSEAHVITGKLAVGQTYVLHEKEAPQFYAVADDITFTVKDTTTVQLISMTDDLKLVSFEFTKTDSSGKALSGAGYQLYICENTASDHAHETDLQNLSGNCWTKYATASSDSDGKVSFTGLQSGFTYALVETQAPDGYQLADGYWILEPDDSADGGWNVAAKDTTLKLSYSKNNGWILKNRTKFILPSAGGNGASPFVAVGTAILFAFAMLAIILHFKKKRS